MNTKKLYAKALKKLRQVDDISEELDIIHRYVCELRKPHVEVRTVVSRDVDAINKLEAQLTELRGNVKQLEQKYKFEKRLPKYPPPPKLKDNKAVFEYIKQMAVDGQNLIDCGTGGTPFDYWQILDGFLVRITNIAASLLNFGTDRGYDALPKERQVQICEVIHVALKQCLLSEMVKAHAALGGRKTELFDSLK